MKPLFEILSDTLMANKPVVLVNVIASSGSTPRGDGARMLITAEGNIAGTIGGGAVEYKAQQMASSALKNKHSGLHSFMLRRNEVEDLGMICGGDVEICYSYLDPADPAAMNFAKAAKQLYQTAEPAWFIMDISGNSKHEVAFYRETIGFAGTQISENLNFSFNKPVQRLTVQNKTYYIEQIIRPSNVYIFGGGHVAQALVPILTSVDFSCIVLDDRPDFVKPNLFSGVKKTVLLDSLDDWQDIDIRSEDYICIMTRGHAHDLNCEYQALQTQARYIGVIGSKHKIAGVNKKLKVMGVSDEALARITTPIGLDIKAETPAEIAISITAQLIEERARKLN